MQRSSGSSPLSCQEIVELAEIFVKAGIDKIKITGGEPLTRPDIVQIIEKLAVIPFLDDISLTTNGVLLNFLAEKLRKAGLKRINISLDTLDRKKYKEITGMDNFYDVIEGIEKALCLDFSAVKINVVVMRGINVGEIRDFLKFAEERNLIIRFIEYMPASSNLENWQKYFVSGDEILSEARKIGELKPQENIHFPASGPAVYYRFRNNHNIFGIINAVSNPFCFRCNRIRIDSAGNLFLCLYDRHPYNLCNIIRHEANDEIQPVIRKIVYGKRPLNPNLPGMSKKYFPSMVNIGG